ncbi:MAG: outer membrane protein assembly factor BamE [Pseudomonadota bacterium]
MRRIRLRTAALHLSVLAVLGGCGGWTNPVNKISPYRIDIQQGNAITQEMLDKLKPGMTPSQVRFILGTPLVVDPFRKDRWDYVYRLEKGGRLVEHRRIAVIFENDRLKGLEGDVTAAAAKPEVSPEPAKQAEEAKK